MVNTHQTKPAAAGTFHTIELKALQPMLINNIRLLLELEGAWRGSLHTTQVTDYQMPPSKSGASGGSATPQGRLPKSACNKHKLALVHELQFNGRAHASAWQLGN